MDISYRWLRELVPSLEEEPETLADRLALLGFPVEALHALKEGLEDIVIARVVEAGRHPDADRLSLCRVDAGTGEELQVICGAPNVRAGGRYPFVPVGGVLPGGMKIKKAKIRGERSFGMLCSPRELGLGSDHAGIMEVHGEHSPGTPFVSAMGLDDVRLDVEITANRGDLLSHVGVAREVAPAGSPPEPAEIPGAPPAGYALASHPERAEVGGVVVRTEAPELCRRFMGAVIRGVRVGPSPDWLQARLRAVGLRPINNVVDATNYVLVELGQPTHTYDLSRLTGSEVIVRKARPGETVTTLDGEERTLGGEMLVIADALHTVNVAGIMGDARTGVDDGTTDVFVECAHFEPTSVRSTRKALGIHSDAGYRYERFVDPGGQERALERVLRLILAHAGGTLEPVVADVHPRPWEDTRIHLRLSRVERLLGVAFSDQEVTDLLSPLGFQVEGRDGGTLTVRVPSWRGADVTREVDLIEEVARRHGFHRFPEDLGPFRPGTVPDHPLFKLEDRVRDLLVREGFLEAQTPPFVGEDEGEVRLQNPLSKEEPVLRRVLLPSLLRRVEYNQARGNRNVRLFELGTSFRAPAEGAGEALPVEEARVALVVTGSRAPAHWAGDVGPVEIWDLKGILGALAQMIWGDHVQIREGEVDDLPTVAASTLQVVHAEGRVVGGGGLVLPNRMDLPPWAGPVFGLELALPARPEGPHEIVSRPLPAHPPADRDLALVVPWDLPASRVEAVARESAGPYLEAVSVFDLYSGEELPQGTRSIAYRFRFRAEDRTLTDGEVDEATRRIVHRLSEELGVRVRGE